MIQQIRDETKKMTKEYNEQCDLIDELQNERKTLQERITTLKNDKLDDKYIIRVLREKLKILEIAQDYSSEWCELNSHQPTVTQADVNYTVSFQKFNSIHFFRVIVFFYEFSSNSR